MTDVTCNDYVYLNVHWNVKMQQRVRDYSTTFTASFTSLNVVGCCNKMNTVKMLMTLIL